MSHFAACFYLWWLYSQASSLLLIAGWILKALNYNFSGVLTKQGFTWIDRGWVMYHLSAKPCDSVGLAWIMFFRSWRLDSRQIEGLTIAGYNIPDIIAPQKTVLPTPSGTRCPAGRGTM